MSARPSIAMVSVRSVRPMLEYLEKIGVGVPDILAAAGIDRSVTDDRDARIPHDAAIAIWRQAIERSGDPFFGLHAGEHIRAGTFDVLEYAIRSSATLGDGLVRLARYHRFLHDVAVIRLERKGDLVTLQHALPPGSPPLPRHPAEFIIAGWLVVARQATGSDFAPEQVTFRHARPSDVSELDRLFRAPLRFESDANGLVLRRELLDVPLVKADPGLCAVLEQHVRELLARLPAAATLSERVRQLVADELATGQPTASTIAQRLHMSRRTLQRRLGEEGTSLRALVDGLRSELALRYLGEGQIALSEIAFLLGFSDQSAFHRAFVRWHGCTPASYRRAQ